MVNERFKSYVGKIKRCSHLPEKLRFKAAKRLVEMKRDEESANHEYINAISFVLDITDPEIKLYGMFDWRKTKEGYDFWKQVADAGF